MSEIFYSHHFASKCQIQCHQSLNTYSSVLNTENPTPCLAAILAVSENYGHANIREIRRVAHLYAPINVTAVCKLPLGVRFFSGLFTFQTVRL
jgi:hypothetical protein